MWMGCCHLKNMVADYIKETDNHVMYRVTPVFEGENLVASGVLMEAESVEDHGERLIMQRERQCFPIRMRQRVREKPVEIQRKRCMC